MNAEKYISELLYDHDCVIIPGFGGFIGNYLSARIHPLHSTFLPPSKSILFNINLKHNDGLLASRIALGENIPYDEAMDYLRKQVDLWNAQLNDHHQLVLDPIGKLIRNREGNLLYEQDQSLNFLSDSFGLASFVSPAIRRTGFQQKMEKKITRYLNAPGARPKVLPKPLKWAAVFLLPLGIATYLGVTNYQSIRNLKVSYSSLFYTTPAAPAPANTKPPTTIYIHTPAKEIKPVTQPEVIKPAEITPSTAVPATSQHDESLSSKPFAVVVGAFRMHENAENLIASLRQKGYDAWVLDTTRTGLFRVSIGTFTDRDKAIEVLASVRSKEFSSAWLLAR
jgi:cell division septation protein DedD